MTKKSRDRRRVNRLANRIFKRQVPDELTKELGFYFTLEACKHLAQLKLKVPPYITFINGEQKLIK